MLDHEGKLLPAEVEIRIVEQVPWPLGTVETGQDGTARGYLPGPGRFIAAANASGTRREAMFQVREEGEAVEVEIRFPGSAVLSGRVVGKSGGLGQDLHFLDRGKVVDSQECAKGDDADEQKRTVAQPELSLG